MMNLKYLLIWLSASMLLGCGCAAALPFSGDTVQVTGNQTEDIVWNASNFGGFCYNLSDDDCIGTETLSIEAGALEGPNIDRTIDEGNLTYTTSSPIRREYELHKNLGLTVESDHPEGDSGYWIEFWMGERYVVIDGNADKLAKPLVEFNSTDTRTLVTGEKWDLGGGFAFEAKQVDLEGKKVWFCLYKNGKELDNEVIGTGYPDLQERVYTYTEDVGRDDDIPIFSCYVSGVFRGTDSNYIQVKYVFLIDDDILQISTGGYYGNMEVVTTTPSQVILKNWKDLYLRPYASTCHITENLSFKTIGNVSAIEFYPHLIRDEPPVLSGGGGFASDSYGYSWNLSENYTIALQQVGLEGNKAMIVLFKDGVVVDERILTEEFIAPVDSDSHYSYAKNGNEIINATLKVVFRGCIVNMAELGEVFQCSEVDGSALINNESHLFKSADSDGMPWNLAEGYVLTVKDIDLKGDEVWLELSKNGVVVEEKILNEDFTNTFAYTSGIGGINCVVDGVFRGDANAVKLVSVNQYSDANGTALLVDESHFYKSRDLSGEWSGELSEGYVLTMMDIDLEGDEVWLNLSKNGVVVMDAIVDTDDDRWFTYCNATGALVFSTYVDAIWRGTDSNIVQLRYTTQYSEVDGRLFIEPDDESRQLHEGYYLTAQEIYYNNSVWLQLSKNSKLVDEGLFYDSFSLQNDATGHTIVSGTISNYYRTGSVQLTSIAQYREATGTAIATWQSMTLHASWRFKNDVFPADPPSPTKTWTVDDSGGANFTSIQAAINTASPGDTIYVRAGTYVENVNVSKRISLIGEGMDVVTVQAADASDHVFKIIADRVDLSGFTATGTTGFWKAGIYLGSDVDHCNISGNNVSNNLYNGIYLESFSNNNVLAHNIANSNYYGVYLESSSDNTLTNNVVSDNDDGIYLSSSNNNMLTDNIVNSNNCGGIYLDLSSNFNTLTGNTANSNSYYGIWLHSSNNNTIYHNNLINNTQNAYDTCTNTWDSGSVGNYYSDYEGNDTSGDGIGNDPHPIPGGGSVDDYPLMQPWTGDMPQKGDLNSDGSITPADAAIALQLAVSGGWDADADVSGDNRVTSLDALMILQMAVMDSDVTPTIVVNELMPDPIGYDYGNETTELYNCGDEVVDIGGWVLKNVDGDTYDD
jgi:S-layer protein (TIGR01567 family)